MHSDCRALEENLILKLRAAEEKVKHYRYAALRLCNGDKNKLRQVMLEAENDFTK